ncbi:MAG: histidinol-phosphate transaminase [Lentisphaerae bacterium RIFOXYB12_FULL_65_16]|nr:MAG: histidinol-phosphate transaminase [Lentisphaerae bacterium RIFOXYA12_64_32]OGV85715.1 MAG: histidinol-phosphate transaminase [Lentisphaerae bacterium RIFOXYB12_FULL_65_16]
MSYVRDDIQRMSGYVPGEQPRDRRYIKLNTNENPYPPSPEVGRALREFDPARLRLYPDPVAGGLRAVAGGLFGLSADWVLAGNGSDDLLTIAVRTFVDQGGRIAFPTPTYSLYESLAEIQGAACLQIDLDAEFELPPDIATRAKGASLLFLARPNAPTGRATPLERMRQVCRDFPGIVWIDEAYADFATDHCVGFVRDFPNVVVSRTLSKSYSLAGVRLGLAFARPELIAEMMKVKDSYNVNALTQVAAIAALKDQAHMQATAARIRATREQVTAALRDLGCKVLPSEANFLLVRTPQPAKAVMQQLREHGILVRYFARDRIDDSVRVTIGSEEEMAAFLAAMSEILGGA